MSLPFYKQQTPFTCSLACLRMVLESTGRKFAEYELSKIIGFDINVGFSPFMIKQVCDIVNVECKIIFENTIENLKELVTNGIYPIILTNPALIYNLTDAEERHYVVVKDITNESVIVNDPDQQFGGEDKEISIEKFLDAWKELSNMLMIVSK